MRMHMGDIVRAPQPLPGALQAFGMGWLGVTSSGGGSDWTSSMGVSDSDSNAAPFAPFVPYGPTATPTELQNAARITAANNQAMADAAQAEALVGGYRTPAEVFAAQNPGGGPPQPTGADRASGGMSSNTMLMIAIGAALLGLALMKR